MSSLNLFAFALSAFVKLILPFDPIINDHFGDILWNNGRKNTAKLFWKRSLSFNPEADEISKIKKKIEYGLD